MFQNECSLWLKIYSWTISPKRVCSTSVPKWRYRGAHFNVERYQGSFAAWNNEPTNRRGPCKSSRLSTKCSRGFRWISFSRRHGNFARCFSLVIFLLLFFLLPGSQLPVAFSFRWLLDLSIRIRVYVWLFIFVTRGSWRFNALAVARDCLDQVLIWRLWRMCKTCEKGQYPSIVALTFSLTYLWYFLIRDTVIVINGLITIWQY